jgi:hypothetical protein
MVTVSQRPCTRFDAFEFNAVLSCSLAAPIERPSLSFDRMPPQYGRDGLAASMENRKHIRFFLLRTKLLN